MIKQAILRLAQNGKLNFNEAKKVFEDIFDHNATPAQIAAFLTSLKMKGESEEEIAGAATAIRERATKLKIRDKFLGIEDEYQPIIDTCGTGGSGLNKFNVSRILSSHIYRF